MAEKDKELIENIEKQEYKYGFTSDIETETIPRGLNEEVVRLISTKKGEPEWMTERRLKAYRHWLNMVPPTWAHLTIPPIDFQDVIYYAAPKPSKKLASMDEVDPELKRTFDKLGIPLEEQMALAGVAVDAVMDSVSVKTTFKETLAEKGIIFCSMSEAIRDYPELIQKYLGSVVPYTDNFYAALNAAVFPTVRLLHSQRRALPDGAFDLFPHQCGGYGPVRADADRGRRRGLCQLSGGVHGAPPGREPVACRRGRNRRREGCRGEVFHRPELVSGRQGGKGRRL